MQDFAVELEAAGLTPAEVRRWQTDAAKTRYHRNVGCYSLADFNAMCSFLQIPVSQACFCLLFLGAALCANACNSTADVDDLKAVTRSEGSVKSSVLMIEP